jgi:hypothetical protein
MIQNMSILIIAINVCNSTLFNLFSLPSFIHYPCVIVLGTGWPSKGKGVLYALCILNTVIYQCYPRNLIKIIKI